ncbi:beta-ketoacyl-ACP synthase III [Oceanobacter sp. 4_MG-2023]|uniref:beta-ketoacyl-ACP synthase III n=1 Tax=Oceanobacter sp. 4_MG-2023 TaxID=3062623 RepID=UPI0027335F8B|nr:beta-ketoacyl-ACP synthase III [Oceanobacter sp. 4_MG-2023]MDP2548179.1 beta-ketoacyl-ACP synthase III [Oceanobacter sp. 4_MG-2023]
MTDILITGTGLYTPNDSISNEELVSAYNTWAEQHNQRNADAITAGQATEAPLSSAAFIEKASGIQHRYTMHKQGMLDPSRMRPTFTATQPGEPPEAVIMGMAAARDALAAAKLQAADIDLLIVACTNHQRAYPSIAVEIQHRLGCSGYAYDMGIACSSATFGLISAYNALKAGTAKRALLVNPEFVTPQVDLTSRDSHFIFGDVATAAVLEPADAAHPKSGFKILDTQQLTSFSDNIRCDGNYTDHCQDALPESRPYFKQEGRKVFKELLPLVTDLIENQLTHNHLQASELKRMWLHQANINMNLFAAKKLLGRLPEPHEAPTVLDEFANTASAGSVIAFHRHHDDFNPGDKGLICSFGAGYSIGSLLIEKC